jgi:hypothetical protein
MPGTPPSPPKTHLDSSENRGYSFKDQEIQRIPIPLKAARIQRTDYSTFASEDASRFVGYSFKIKKPKEFQYRSGQQEFKELGRYSTFASEEGVRAGREVSRLLLHRPCTVRRCPIALPLPILSFHVVRRESLLSF